MSNRVKLGSLALLLLGLIVVTTWYGLRRAPSVAGSDPAPALGDRLGLADKAIAPPSSWDPQGSAASPTPLTQREAADSPATSHPRTAAAPAAALAARPPSKRKRSRPVEGTPAAAQAEAEAEAPAPAPTTPPAASVAPTPVGMLIVRHHNGVGTSLQLVKVTYLLDGNVAFTEERDKLAQSRDFEAFTRRTSTGEHSVSVIAEFQGNGRGVFSYFDDYRYKAQSAHRFIIREGATTKLTIMLLEKTGPMTSFENRLTIGFKVD